MTAAPTDRVPDVAGAIEAIFSPSQLPDPVKAAPGQTRFLPLLGDILDRPGSPARDDLVESSQTRPRGIGDASRPALPRSAVIGIDPAIQAIRLRIIFSDSRQRAISVLRIC